MYNNLLKVAAFSLLVLAAGCAKDSDPQSLATPELTFQEHSAVEYSFMWKAVEHADSYVYKVRQRLRIVCAGTSRNNQRVILASVCAKHRDFTQIQYIEYVGI